MKTQAWGWLAAAVLAAGLNASYHDGGLHWLHRIAGRVGDSTTAVLALATGNAEGFLTEARRIELHRQRASCPFEAAVAEVQDDLEAMTVPVHSEFAQLEVMSARKRVRLARLEANRARIEAELAHLRIPAIAVNPVVVADPTVSICPRVRVNIPRIPRVKMYPVPQVRIDTGAGPV